MAVERVLFEMVVERQHFKGLLLHECFGALDVHVLWFVVVDGKRSRSLVMYLTCYYIQ